MAFSVLISSKVGVAPKYQAEGDEGDFSGPPPVLEDGICCLTQSPRTLNHWRRHLASEIVSLS